jgi:DNA-binding FadR family transcriptional regulator
MGFHKLPSISRADQVRDQLEAAIRRHDYPVGSKLPSERELTELFGVSRVSVREGIRSLEAVGLVEVQHGNGCFVADPADRPRRDMLRLLSSSRSAVVELLTVRGALDEVAAEQATERQDPGGLAKIEALHVAFAASSQADEPDLEGIARIDVAFHLAIAEASGSQLLLDLLTDLHHHLGDARRASFAPHGQLQAALSDHASIVEAVLSGDAKAARQAVAAHIAQVKETIQRIPSHTEREDLAAPQTTPVTAMVKAPTPNSSHPAAETHLHALPPPA